MKNKMLIFFIVGLMVLLLSACGGGGGGGGGANSQSGTGGVTVKFTQIIIYPDGTGLGEMTITNTSSTYAKEVSQFSLALVTNIQNIQFTTFTSGLYDGIKSSPPSLDSTQGSVQNWQFLTPGLILQPGQSVVAKINFTTNRVVSTDTQVTAQDLNNFVQSENVTANTLALTSTGTIVLHPSGLSDVPYVSVQIYDQSNHLVYNVTPVPLNTNTSVTLPTTTSGITYTVFYQIVEVNGKRYTAAPPSDGVVTLTTGEQKTIPGPYGLAWQSLGNPGITSGRAYQISSTIFATQVNVLFQDGSQSDKATVMYWNGSTPSSGSWVRRGNAGFGGRGVQESTLLSDGSDLYAAFRESENSNIVEVYKYSGSNWNAIFTSSGPGYTPSIARDSSGNIYLAYTTEPNGGEIKIYKITSNSTELLTSPEASDAKSTSITVIDSTPYVAYAKTTGGLYIKKYSGTSWSEVGGSVSVGSVSDVVLKSASPNLYVLYKVSSKAHVSSCNPSLSSPLWTAVGTGGVSEGDTQFMDLYAVSSSNLYVSYCDLAHNSKVTVKHYDGNTWNSVGKAGITNQEGLYTSIVYKDGFPYVSFSDSELSGKLTVLYYDPN